MRYIRDLKHLPRLKIDPQDHAFVEETCRGLVEAARRRTPAGAPLFVTSDPGAEPACRLSNFGHLVEYAAALLDPQELLGCLDLLLSTQGADGQLPDRVSLAGEAVFLAGPADAPLGEGPPLDTTPLLVKALDAYYRLTGDVAGYLQRAPRLYAALEVVPLSADRLVYVDPNRPRPAHAWADTVALTGNVLLPTLLYWEAARRLAIRLQALEEHEDARQWFEVEVATLARLPDFRDPLTGLFWAASESGHRGDLWGSAYAAVIRRASKKQSRILGQWLLEHRGEVFHRGHLRALPPGEYWPRLLAPIPEGQGPNGGYWAAPAGWALRTVALVDADAARELAADLLATWREGGVRAWINPAGEAGEPGCLTAAACLLGSLAPA